jgi:predicted metalloprotease
MVKLDPLGIEEEPLAMRRAGIALAALALLGACDWPEDQAEPAPAGASIPPGPQSPPQASPQAPTQTEPLPQATGVGGLTVDELFQDLNSAQVATDQFWRDNWAEHFTGQYQPPQVLGLYDGSKQGPGAPTCGGAPLQRDNALYCIGQDFVGWDVHLIARGMEMGDSWPYLVIAHEWAHAIQQRLSQELHSQSAELQADCLAGATLYGSREDGKLQFDQGDEKELVRALVELADETAWTSTEDHGDPFERVEAFNLGRRGGVRSCLPGVTQTAAG